MAKPKRAKQPVPEQAVSLRELGIERWVPREVHRRDLHDAPYNPRHISDDAKARLRAILAKIGVVMPVVWNERTKRIVGGHQRIGELDGLVGHDNYTLTIAVVDVDEEREKDINLALNNAAAQGDWSLDKLGEMFAGGLRDYEATGFTPADIYQLYGEQVMEQAKPEDIATITDRFQQKRAEQEGAVQSFRAQRDNPHFFVVAVFRDQAERDRFLACLDQLAPADARAYIDGRILKSKLGL